MSSGSVFPGLQFSKSAARRHYSRHHAVEPGFLVVGDRVKLEDIVGDVLDFADRGLVIFA